MTSTMASLFHVMSSSAHRLIIFIYSVSSVMIVPLSQHQPRSSLSVQVQDSVAATKKQMVELKMVPSRSKTTVDSFC